MLNIIKSKLNTTYRKISTNKIFISDGEFKHTNDKVNITLYVYNKQKLNYLLKLKKRYIRLFKNPKFANKLKKLRKLGLNIFFNKNVEFNIINLKYFYFNSKIFSQPLELKLKKKRNVLRYLKVLIRKSKIKNVKLAEKSKKFFNFNIFNSDNFLQQDNTKSK